jgi:DNA-binding transcriptional MerR regulator
MQAMAIGELAKVASTKVQTIRYYEEIGLIAPHMRSRGGHRLYSSNDVQRLRFIRHARELGFSIEAIRELLDLSDNPETSCSAADLIARTHLDQIELRLTKLRALRKELRRMVEECGHGRVGQCRVIEVLSDHRHCSGDH